MPTVDTITLAEVKSRKTQWLWEPYIPIGTVSVLFGNGGQGKSFLSLAIAAAVTKGAALPGGKAGAPADVIVQNAENALPTVVKPRLEMLGADCTRVHCINETERRLTLTDERIEAAIIQHKAKYFVIDPVQSYLGHGVSMNRAESIRLVFTHLEQVAEHNKCAIMLVGHLNKGQVSAAQYRGLGSVDVFNAVPSVLYLGKTDDDTRVLVHGKSNLDETGPSLEFRLSKRDGFEWLGESDMSLEELLAAKPGARGSRLEEAEEFLRNVLAEGRVPMTEIEAIAADSDITLRTLERAKKSVGVKVVRANGHWHWSL